MLEKIKYHLQQGIDWSFILLCFAFISSLIFFNRPADDDYFFLHAIKNNNAFFLSFDYYMENSGRILAVFLTALAVMSGQYISILTPLLSILLLFTAIHFILKQLLEKKRAFKYTLLLGILIFFSVFHIGESWYWTSAFFPHTLSFLLLLFSIAIFLLRKKTLLHFVSLAIIALYIGNSSEISGIMLMFSLTIIVFFKIIKNKSNQKGLILFLSFTLIGLVLNYLSPGTTNRKEILSAAYPLSFSHAYAYGLFILFKKTAISLLFILPISIFCIPLWHKINKKHDIYSFIHSKWKRIIFAYIAFVLLYQLPIAFLFHDIGPDRIYLLFSAVTAILISIFLAFFLQKINLDFLKPIIILSALLFFSIQFNISKEYANAYDSFTQEISNAKDKKQIEVKTLPPSGLLYPLNLENDNKTFVYQFLTDYYKLKRRLKVKN